jgi:hypothetical protein
MESFDSTHGHVDEVVEVAAAMHIDHSHTEEMVVDDKKKVDETKKMDKEMVVADKIKVDEKKEDAEMMVLALPVPSIYHSSCDRCITPPICNMWCCRGHHLFPLLGMSASDPKRSMPLQSLWETHRHKEVLVQRLCNHIWGEKVWSLLRVWSQPRGCDC